MHTPVDPGRDDVAAAFALLLEELRAERQAVNQAGARAFGSGDYGEVERLRALGEHVGVLAERVEALAAEWAALRKRLDVSGRPQKAKATLGHANKRPSRPAREPRPASRRGQRTPERRYYLPILRALVALGGSAPVKLVLERVLEELRGELTATDLQKLPSNREFGWRNSARWARQDMVAAGLLSNSSPRGIWEITERGRAYLVEYGDG